MENNPFESPQTQSRSKVGSEEARPKRVIPSPRSYRIGRRFILAYYILFVVLFPFMFVNSMVQMTSTSDALAFEILQFVTVCIAIVTIVAMYAGLFTYFWAVSWIIRRRPPFGQALLEIFLFYLLFIIPFVGLIYYDQLFKPKNLGEENLSPQTPPLPIKPSVRLRSAKSSIKWIL
jgi:hypothetical protein